MKGDKAKRIFFLREDFNGLGKVQVQWSPDFNFIATCGENNVLHIIDRQGKTMDEAHLTHPNRVKSLEWDKDGESIAIMQENMNLIMLYDLGKRAFNQVNISNQKDKVSFCKWSKTNPVLAFGTEKGALIFYAKKNQRIIPCIGKHSKRIVTGDWNKEGFLMTAGDDKIMTLSNMNGDTVKHSFNVKGIARELKWARQKTDERDQETKHVTAVMNNSNINLMDINTAKILEINFQTSYGKITHYQWYGDGYMVVGFTNGIVSAISTHMREIGNEIHQKVLFPHQPIEALIVSDELSKIAAASQGTIKFVSLSDWEELSHETITLPADCGSVTSLSWTSDGQILVVCTSVGHTFGFLTVTPSLFDADQGFAAILTSLSEISIFDCVNKNALTTRLLLEIEPATLKLAEEHLAVASANMILYYRWAIAKGHHPLPEPKLICKRDYFGTIKQIVLNEKWTAVLSDGKCTLHLIESEGVDDKRFPQNDSEKPINFIAMTKDFLLMIDTVGRLKYYFLYEEAFIAEYRPENPIVKVFPNHTGTKCICIDNTGCGYLFNPVNDQSIILPNFSGNTERIIWDIIDINVFCTVEPEKLQTYIYKPYSLEGASVIHLQEYLKLEDVDTPSMGVMTTIELGLKPIILRNGYIYCHSKSEGIRGQYLATHSYINNWHGATETDEGHYRCFLQNLALSRFSPCFQVAKTCGRYSVKFFEVLGKQALKSLELDISARAYQLAKNPGMVLAIESIKEENEKLALMGEVALILHQHDLAQDLFLKSSKKEKALELRCDLHDWQMALKLASSLQPEKVPYICRKLALQKENQGSYKEAKKLFESAQMDMPGNAGPSAIKEVNSHNTNCAAGIARSSVHLGDVTRAVGIASSLSEKDKQLILDIAQVCENMKQWLEAAQLYQKGGAPEKAASIYIRIKHIKQAIPLIEKINSPKLLRELAKAQEAEKHYKEAEHTYILANDWESVIRLNVKYLENFEKAQKIFHEKCPTTSSAGLLAKHCETLGARKEAIEFRIMAGQREEAFVMAQSHDEMDKFAEIIAKVDDKNLEEHLRIAQYFEGKNQWGKAAVHYEKCDNYSKAMKFYIQAGEEFIHPAIKMVGRLKIDAYTSQMVDYLMGEGGDGVPKDPSYTLQLYRELGNKKQTLKIAMTIATQEQEVGNYKFTHDIFYEVFHDIMKGKQSIPAELRQKLTIIHSYMLAKRMMKTGDHIQTARLLSRVAKNISQFPLHVVQILISTVVESSRAGFRRAAYEWALLLVKPEYRSKLSESHEKKITNIARKPVKTDDDPDTLSECPFCHAMVPDMELDCQNCKNTIPFCIASGKHMITNEWTHCPKCGFPANISYFRKVLDVEATCPMCEKPVDSKQLKIVHSPPLKDWLGQKDEEEAEDEAPKEEGSGEYLVQERVNF